MLFVLPLPLPSLSSSPLPRIRVLLIPKSASVPVPSKTESLGTPTVEHSLSHHACFTSYLSLFESTLQDFVSSEGSTNGDFYQQLKECKDKVDVTPEEKLFIDCLLASADYDSFYSGEFA